MSQLIDVYNSINTAEKQTRNGDLPEALKQYKHALALLANLKCQGTSSEIVHALELLRQDIDSRIKELENLQERRNPMTPKNGAVRNSSVSLAKTRSWDNSRNMGSGLGSSSDPLLISILGKLQSNLINSISEQCKEDPQVLKELDGRIAQQFSQFRKELALYEQKKSKDYNARLEQAIAENKKLSNQILKLRGRWDSLVESAKQRRSRQHED
ncbi:ZYBA0S10-03246g1_1 [Zygosaccharomyces bailii CLIB 213]|uniref:ZYBA0S10-03246g1_1 n=1 Tax=Zygosaccharomyces bailii (strain CLIB 213 / ATCC 58445 / CBS 680 / BCRC 21525 / NBRC 1098 / NCYC 1416 / NRRL Y-2227) TaxID=1333698 RepID=A0A8J2TB79_ZYGB2|nr:ZYBA0S10-03246g1_1 [Zygosaccharomyces bailii CLIB 213]